MADTKNKPDAANLEASLLFVVVPEGEEEVPVPVSEDPVGDVWLPELEPVFVAVDPLAVAVEGNRLAGSVTFLHERSYNGDVPMVASLVLLARRPKLGTGVVGAASCRTYHQVFTFPKADAHPISSQKIFALAMLGTPRFSVFPLTGHPVSVIQTGFPPAAPAVALYASQKSV
jgi:hypothetical protein